MEIPIGLVKKGPTTLSLGSCLAQYSHVLGPETFPLGSCIAFDIILCCGIPFFEGCDSDVMREVLAFHGTWTFCLAWPDGLLGAV